MDLSSRVWLSTIDFQDVLICYSLVGDENLLFLIYLTHVFSSINPTLCTGSWYSSHSILPYRSTFSSLIDLNFLPPSFAYKSHLIFRSPPTLYNVSTIFLQVLIMTFKYLDYKKTALNLVKCRKKRIQVKEKNKYIN